MATVQGPGWTLEQQSHAGQDELWPGDAERVRAIKPLPRPSDRPLMSLDWPELMVVGALLVLGLLLRARGRTSIRIERSSPRVTVRLNSRDVDIASDLEVRDGRPVLTSATRAALLASGADAALVEQVLAKSLRLEDGRIVPSPDAHPRVELTTVVRSFGSGGAEPRQEKRVELADGVSFRGGHLALDDAARAKLTAAGIDPTVVEGLEGLTAPRGPGPSEAAAASGDQPPAGGEFRSIWDDEKAQPSIWDEDATS